MARSINLIVFNENYWDKGLIYTQNLLPLIEYIKHNKNFGVRLVSFTSIFMLWKNRNKIKALKNELSTLNIELINYPILFYPTRLMLVRWILIPFFYANVFRHIQKLDKIARKDWFWIRSYQCALGFSKFFKNKEALIFDPRTDWIIENINAGNFNVNSKTVKFWLKQELKIVRDFHKTVFISDVFKDDIISRHSLNPNPEKYPILYNPIDYSHFKNNEIISSRKDFLYTGSLGRWNKLETYLNFFRRVHDYFPNANLIICTNADSHTVEKTTARNDYKSIRNKIILYFNKSYDELPKIYRTCKYGLQLMSKKDSRLGVKFMEYIASDIIPVVNQNVEGAIKVCRAYKIGCIINESDCTNKIIETLHSGRSFDEDEPRHQDLRLKSDLGNVHLTIGRILKE